MNVIRLARASAAALLFAAMLTAPTVAQTAQKVVVKPISDTYKTPKSMKNSVQMLLDGTIGEKPAKGSLVFEDAFNTEKKQTSLVFGGDFFGNLKLMSKTGMTKFGSYTLDKTSYLLLETAKGARCTKMPAAAAAGGLGTPDIAGSKESLGELVSGKVMTLPLVLIGKESVSGVDTVHYKVAPGTFDLLRTAAPVTRTKALTATTAFTYTEGEMWLATPGDFIVKFTAKGTATMGFGGETFVGKVQTEFVRSEINTGNDIELPASCKK